MNSMQGSQPKFCSLVNLCKMKMIQMPTEELLESITETADDMYT